MKQRLILLIMVLVLSGGPAYAEWEKIGSGEDGGFVVYVDLDSVRRKGNVVKIWRLFDLKTTKTWRGISYLSSKGFDEFDCTDEQSRILASYLYASQMGRGQILHSDSNPGKWEPIMPGSVDQVLWKVACGKR